MQEKHEIISQDLGNSLCSTIGLFAIPFFYSKFPFPTSCSLNALWSRTGTSLVINLHLRWLPLKSIKTKRCSKATKQYPRFTKKGKVASKIHKRRAKQRDNNISNRNSNALCPRRGPRRHSPPATSEERCREVKVKQENDSFFSFRTFSSSLLTTMGEVGCRKTVR